MRSVLQAHLPRGFQQTVGYGMIREVVPQSLYPQGYHTDPSRGLPLVALASPPARHCARKQFLSYGMP